MSVSRLEAFLARIYVDAEARERFLCDPSAVASDAGLTTEEIEAVKQIDRVGLELLADSLARKRQATDKRRSMKRSSQIDH